MFSESHERFLIGWRDAERINFDKLPKVKYSSDKLYTVGSSTVRRKEVFIDAKFDFKQRKWLDRGYFDIPDSAWGRDRNQVFLVQRDQRFKTL